MVQGQTFSTAISSSSRSTCLGSSARMTSKETGTPIRAPSQPSALSSPRRMTPKCLSTPLGLGSSASWVNLDALASGRRAVDAEENGTGPSTSSNRCEADATLGLCFPRCRCEPILWSTIPWCSYSLTRCWAYRLPHWCLPCAYAAY